jgi:hypothetical protein
MDPNHKESAGLKIYACFLLILGKDRVKAAGESRECYLPVVGYSRHLARRNRIPVPAEPGWQPLSTTPSDIAQRYRSHLC